MTFLGAVQIERLTRQLIEVEKIELHRRCARVLAEIIDHLLHGLDLLHDRMGRSLQQIGIAAGQLRQHLSTKSLGGQLDRRQWVFDFVRQSSRHFTPGRFSLHL